VGAEKKMTSIGKPVPELPVADVERAQQHYRDVLGFEIGWLYPDKGIGAVSRGLNLRFIGCLLKILTRPTRS
jgi:catechol 2,3-dioxygenase-like lactoylglutathione lyase family enzyme